MKNNSTARRSAWGQIGASLAGLLLLAGAGCTCVTVNAPIAQSGSPRGAPTGGNFVPMQAVLISSGTLTVCNPPQQVSGTYVQFYPPQQIPNTGDTGFQGSLWNASAGKTIFATDYYLQWFVTGANTGCCTPLSGSSQETQVRCPVTAGTPYGFTAHFKVGKVPPNNPTIQLNGAWTH